MTIHYLWIGNPSGYLQYLNNVNKCSKLNPEFGIKIWENNACEELLKEYQLLELSNAIPFISKCNLLKYIILDKFGGIYTDFDILWKVPFIKIINDYNSNLILTCVGNSPFFIGNQRVFLMDDPFIVSKPGVLGKCIDFCKNRTNFRYDGDIYMNNKQLTPSKLEPFGPFGLTEWLYFEKINFTFFPQETFLDNKGILGEHQQKSNWK